MVNCQTFSFLPVHRLFVSFSQKEKGVGSIDTLSAAKLPVAGLRRQAATGVENIYPPIFCARRRKFAVCADDDSSIRRCCGIVWRLPQQPQSPSESARCRRHTTACFTGGE